MSAKARHSWWINFKFHFEKQKCINYIFTLNKNKNEYEQYNIINILLLFTALRNNNKLYFYLKKTSYKLVYYIFTYIIYSIITYK